MEHTPGPWIIGKYREEESGLRIYATKGPEGWEYEKGPEIAQLHQYVRASPDEKAKELYRKVYSDDQIKANANLITASPKLLEAAKAALDDIKWAQAQMRVKPAKSFVVLKEACDWLQNAITQAERKD